MLRPVAITCLVYAQQCTDYLTSHAMAELLAGGRNLVPSGFVYRNKSHRWKTLATTFPRCTSQYNPRSLRLVTAYSLQVCERVQDMRD